MNPDRYEFKGLVLHSKDDILSALDGRLGSNRRFWLITAGNSKTVRGVDVRSDILEEFIVHHCIVLGDESFFRSRVRLLVLRSDPEGHG
jgi:hypothetical protein